MLQEKFESLILMYVDQAHILMKINIEKIIDQLKTMSTAVERSILLFYEVGVYFRCIFN